MAQDPVPAPPRRRAVDNNGSDQPASSSDLVRGIPANWTWRPVTRLAPGNWVPSRRSDEVSGAVVGLTGVIDVPEEPVGVRQVADVRVAACGGHIVADSILAILMNEARGFPRAHQCVCDETVRTNVQLLA